MFSFAFLSGSRKPLTRARRVHVTSKAKKCWNKFFGIVKARVDLTIEVGSSWKQPLSSRLVAKNIEEKKVFWRENFPLLKGDKSMSKTKLSLLAGKICAFKRGHEKSKTKTSFGGKIVLREKSLSFWMVSASSQKTY